LTTRIYGRTLSEEDFHLWPAARASLKAVHAAGLCHGDVRLANFMVTSQDGQDVVVILDFGRARHCSPGEEWLQREEEDVLCCLLRGETGVEREQDASTPTRRVQGTATPKISAGRSSRIKREAIELKQSTIFESKLELCERTMDQNVRPGALVRPPPFPIKYMYRAPPNLLLKRLI
jgi:serine/threonine protein kinase